MAKPQPAKPKLKPIRHAPKWIPLVILAGVVAVMALNYAGYIHLPHFGSSHVYEISQPATIGVPCSYDFFDELTPLLGPESSTDPAIYTFYLGSGVGFPPMGLILGIDGKLKGTPTGKGGNFEVCVKDAGGHSACRTYHLTVNPKNDNADNETPGYACPATSCGTGSCCGEAGETTDGITPATAGVLVRDFCECPSDTYYSGVTDTQAAGGPWKICNCK
jgi:hypothetical protein